jgi:small subunit ribosomal protein S20
VRDLRETTDKEAAIKRLPEVVSMLDRLAAKKIIHKNKAANLKSKLSKAVNKL